MAPRITALIARDVRFPSSDFAHGSDAMNPDPDYSAAAVTLETDDPAPIGGEAQARREKRRLAQTPAQAPPRRGRAVL